MLRRIVRHAAPHRPSRCATLSSALRCIIRHAAPHRPSCCTTSSERCATSSTALRHIVHRAAPNHPPRCAESSATLRHIVHRAALHLSLLQGASIAEPKRRSRRCLLLLPMSTAIALPIRGCESLHFFQIPLIPPSSVVHSSAHFSINSQFPYILELLLSVVPF